MKATKHQKELLLQKIDANRKVFRLEVEAVGGSFAPVTDLVSSFGSLYSHAGSWLRSIYALLKVAS